MSLKELEGQNWRASLHNDSDGGRVGLLVYTPFCGTCKVAERMLEVVQATGNAIPLYKIDLNYAPELAGEWRITSVPCLVLLEGGEPVWLEYAMRSVDHLYSRLKKEE